MLSKEEIQAREKVYEAARDGREVTLTSDEVRRLWDSIVNTAVRHIRQVDEARAELERVVEEIQKVDIILKRSA